MEITQKNVYENVMRLYRELGRPVCLGDLKEVFDVREKRDSVRAKNWGKADMIARRLRELFKKDLLCRSEKRIKLRNYKVSPFASMDSKTVNAYFYAPPELAGKTVSFTFNGQKVETRFITYKERKVEMTKKEMVLEVLRESETAMTAGMILEEINKRYNAYKIESRKDFYNAVTSLLRAVLKRLRKEGLRGIKVDGRWVWYFTEGQLERFKENYIRSNEILRTARDLVKSEKCVPINRLLSEVTASPYEVRYLLRRLGKCIEVEIRVESKGKGVEIHLSVPEFRRDSFIDWLGFVVPRSQSGYGYESFIVDLDSDWEEALKREIKKSPERVNIKALMGKFYEKMVVKLFEIICSGKLKGRLSRFSIPFVFRDERVGEVWIVTEKGRKLEFDVLIRGTFYPFNVMVDGRSSLDIIMPIECKYRIVKAEHVINFDERIKEAFGNFKNVLPLMIGLSWKDDAMHIAKRLGIMTLYFSAIDRLLSEMTRRKYRHEDEWKRVEEMLNKGEITVKELREKLKKGEWRFMFENELREYQEGKVSNVYK